MSGYFIVMFHMFSIKIFFRGDLALIGLAVMGQNLILNMNDHGFTVSTGTEKIWFIRTD